MNNRTDELNLTGYNFSIIDNAKSTQLFDEIQFYIIIIQCIIGITGNTISVIVWNAGSKSSHVLCSIYFKLLSAINTFAATYRLIHEFYTNDYYGVHVIKSQLWCKVDQFCFYFAPQLSTWIIVYLCTKRMFCLCFPSKFNMNDSRKVKMAFSVILMSAVVLNSPRFFESSEDEYGYCNHDVLDKTIKTISEIYVLCVIPILVLPITNVIIITKIKFLKINRTNDNSGRNFETRITIIAVGASVLQCVSILPTMVLKLVWGLKIENDIRDIPGELWPAVVLGTVTLYLNNNLNFVQYCFIGKHFRKDLKEIFCCRIC